MLIKLTNSAKDFFGNPVVINTKMIVSIHRDTRVDSATNVVSDVTYIFCPPHGTWEVQETLDEILALIDKENSDG